MCAWAWFEPCNRPTPTTTPTTNVFFTIQYKYHLILCIFDTFDLFDTDVATATATATIGFGYQQLHG